MLVICHVFFDSQGFHSSDSDDQHSDDEDDHVEGMSGDEQMGEQQDFEGSDSFDEVCYALRTGSVLFFIMVGKSVFQSVPSHT